MSCCGGKRRQFPAATQPAKMKTTATDRQPAPPMSDEVTFEYTGQTALTVRGPLTGRTYRFAYPGALVSVDAREAAALTAVPHLKRRKTAV